MPDRLEELTVTIANGASLSGAVSLAGLLLVGIVMPASWTAADLTFQASRDGSTYNNVYDEGGLEVTVDAAVSRHIVIDPARFAGCEYLKVRSGTSGVAVNQAAARSLVLIVRTAS